MKNDDAGGIGSVFVVIFNSDIRRGRADTTPNSSKSVNFYHLMGNILIISFKKLFIKINFHSFTYYI